LGREWKIQMNGSFYEKQRRKKWTTKERKILQSPLTLPRPSPLTQTRSRWRLKMEKTRSDAMWMIARSQRRRGKKRRRKRGDDDRAADSTWLGSPNRSYILSHQLRGPGRRRADTRTDYRSACLGV